MTDNAKPSPPGRHHALHALFAAGLALLAGGCTSPPQRLPMEGRVTEYGLYLRGTERVYSDPEAPSGQSRALTGRRHLVTTRQIPLQRGVSFGFCYEVSGFAPGVAPKVVVETTHPPFGRPGQAPAAGHSTRRAPTPKGGAIADCVGYGFDHDFELVPGLWQFTVKVDDVALLKQEFTVTPTPVPPDNVCDKPVYPPGARRAGLKGVTHLRFTISPEGNVVAVDVLASSGSTLLDQAAIQSLVKCRLLPAIENGVPRSSSLEVKYVWQPD